MKNNKKLSWIKCIVTIALFVCICLSWAVFVCYTFTLTTVHGSSMSPTLVDNQTFLSTTVVNNLKRGNIISIKHPNKEDTYLVKRIIGLPGDTVHIDEQNNVYVNGDLLNEPYLAKDAISYVKDRDYFELGDNEYFVLGDNRSYSSDSRTYGLFTKDNILSKVLIVNEKGSYLCFALIIASIPAITFIVVMTIMYNIFKSYYTD